MGTSLDSINYRTWIFNTVKYLVYGYLCYNGFQFYADETAAGAITFQNGLSLADVIEVYSATIDTTFWIMLVLLLELETYIIDDKVLKRPVVKWNLMGARGICYGMIVWAWYGYIVKFLFQADIEPMAVVDACTLVNQNFSLLLGLEEYVRLDGVNCLTLAGQELYRLGGQNIVAPLPELEYARNVAMIDIFNSSSWIGVVIILEVDVWYQLKGTYEGRIYWVSYVIKAVLYSILIGCALAWGYTGVWLDISDAALWLFAFFFIELNLFQWHEETHEEAQQKAASVT